MDQNANQPVSAPIQTPLAASSTPPLANQTTAKSPSQSYFARLFSGRVNRRNFILGNLLPTIILILLTILLIVLSQHNPWAITNLQLAQGQSANSIQQESPIAGILNFILVLITFVATIFIFINTFSLTIRRLHDLDKSGWLWLLAFIPLVNTLFGIYLTFFPGTTGENKYGTAPLARINIKQDILRLS